MNLKFLLLGILLCSINFIESTNQINEKFLTPVKCKNDSHCRRHGLMNYYCRKHKNFLAFIRHHSECQPKRGNLLLNMYFCISYKNSYYFYYFNKNG